MSRPKLQQVVRQQQDPEDSSQGVSCQRSCFQVPCLQQGPCVTGQNGGTPCRSHQRKESRVPILRGEIHTKVKQKGT